VSLIESACEVIPTRPPTLKEKVDALCITVKFLLSEMERGLGHDVDQKRCYEDGCPCYGTHGMFCEEHNGASEHIHISLCDVHYRTRKPSDSPGLGIHWRELSDAPVARHINWALGLEPKE